jgi:hypothetical protein
VWSPGPAAALKKVMDMPPGGCFEEVPYRNYRRIGGDRCIGFGHAGVRRGSFTTYMSGVLTGFHSRTWTKSASYDVDTEIWYPDTNLGDQTYLSCFSGATGVHDWGAQPSGSYYFDVSAIGGQTSGASLSVNSLKVQY